MTSVPWALLEREYSDMGVETDSLPPRDQRAVGMLFLPQAEDAAAECRSVVEKILTQAGLAFHGWRTVPVDPSSLGQQSRENQPNIQQVKCCCWRDVCRVLSVAVARRCRPSSRCLARVFSQSCHHRLHIFGRAAMQLS